jgi:vesicle-associated membrane protein 7
MSRKNITGILYAVFARHDVKLCEYKKAGVDNTFGITQITQQILTRIDHTSDTRRSFKTSTANVEIHFHIQVVQGLTVLAVTDPEFKKTTAHFFIQDVLAQFKATTKDWTTAPALHFQNVFARTLETAAEKYSNPANDKATYIRNQLKEAKEMYMEQINLLIERGEHIDILEDKTNTLAKESVVFRAKARAMKMRFFWKNIKLIVAIVIVALIALFLLVWFGCGVPDFKTCADMIHSLKGVPSTALVGVDNGGVLNGTLDENNPISPPPEVPEQPPEAPVEAPVTPPVEAPVTPPVEPPVEVTPEVTPEVPPEVAPEVAPLPAPESSIA